VSAADIAACHRAFGQIEAAMNDDAAVTDEQRP
jgi:hypothetical protein